MRSCLLSAVSCCFTMGFRCFSDYASGVPCPAGQSRLLLQLLLELIKKSPVGALSDNLLRTALDHPHLMQTQGVETHRVLRVVLCPLAVGNPFQGLEGVVVVLRQAFV